MYSNANCRDPTTNSAYEFRGEVVCTKCRCKLENYFGAGGLPYCSEHVEQAQAEYAQRLAEAPKESPIPPKPTRAKPKVPSKYPRKHGAMHWYNKAEQRAPN